MGIKILLAEDHELTRKGFAYGLKALDNTNIVSEVENGKEAVLYAKKYNPDIILMDIAMPILNGINATKEIKSSNPNIKVIMLTSLSEKENVLSAFNSGANAYCMKNIKIEDLVNIIKTVIDGALWIDPSIAGYILEILKLNGQELENKTGTDFNLTNREKEILKLISEGLCNKDIAEKLYISLYTVKNHVKSIIQKLAVEDRTQAAIMALKKNII